MKIGKVGQEIVCKNKSNSQPLKPQAAQSIRKDLNDIYEKEQIEKEKWVEQQRIEKRKKFQEFIHKPGEFIKKSK